MKLIKKLFRKTLTGKIFSIFRNGYYYFKDYYLISDTLYSEAFALVIKKYLNTDIHKDWIGRLYCIVNPNIGPNGMYDFNRTVIELDGENTNNNEYVKTWVYKQLQLISDLFKINRLYDYINLKLEHVGPVNQDNYLLVFDIVSRKEFTNSIKSFFKHLLFYIMIIAAAIIAKIYIF